MSEQANPAKSHAIIVSGMVSEVTDYTNAKTGVISFSVHIFVLGSKALMKVRLESQPPPDKYVPGLPVKMKVTLSEYQGNINFNEVVV